MINHPDALFPLLSIFSYLKCITKVLSILKSKVSNIKEILKPVISYNKTMKIIFILNDESMVPTYIDCGLVGHYNKSYYKSSKHNSDTADSSKFV